MDLKALLLIQGVVVATCLSTFVAARQLAPDPSVSSPCVSLSSLCSRALATTLWGAAFAFFSLMADAWPASKVSRSLSPYGQSLIARFLIKLLSILHAVQLSGIYLILCKLFVTLRFRQILRRSTNPEPGPDTMSMSTKLRRVIGDILDIFFGIHQPRAFLKSTRIVANTYIVLGMSDLSRFPCTHTATDKSPVNEDKMADALTLGYKTAENSLLMQLNEAGKLALLESSVLPNYKQLRFLDGRSGIGSLIIGVQAIGYVTSTVYRAIHHLPVSPIEAIGFAFSMLVIVHSLVHSLAAFCQSALVIYLNPTQEQELLDKCKSIRWSKADEEICRNGAFMGMVAVGSVVVAFTVLVEWHVLRVIGLDAIGPILFLLSLIIQLFSHIILLKCAPILGCFLMSGSGMINFGGIVVSIVATIVNWHTNKFDSHPFCDTQLTFPRLKVILLHLVMNLT
jgi:hypothetical protein